MLVAVGTYLADQTYDVQAQFMKSHSLGAPVRSMQHPLHYPHGTLFMAPGPAGNTAAVPDDPNLRQHMLNVRF